MTNDSLPPVTDPSLYPRVPDVPPPGRNAKGAAVAGIVAAGALAIGIGVAVTSHGSASAQTTGQSAGLGAQLGGGPGGRIAGEQRVTGTITAVGTSSITVRSTSGTATYGVNGTTEITVNGASGSLQSLSPGTAVTVHVYPSGSSMMAERVIVGADAGFGPPDGNGPGPGGTGQQAPAITT